MNLPLLFLTLSILAPSALAATAPFEGAVKATMEVRGQEIPVQYTIKGHRVRIDMRFMQQTSTVIADVDTQTQTVLIPRLQAYAIHHGAAPSNMQPNETPAITDMNKTETIAGHVCEDYAIDSAKYSGTLCVAKDIGGDALGAEMNGPLGSAMKGLKGIKDPGMPLRLAIKAKTSDAAGQDMTMLVTQVSPGPVSDTMFSVPPGWREMPSIMPTPH